MLATYIHRLSRAPVRYRAVTSETEQALKNYTDLHMVAHQVPAHFPHFLLALANSPQLATQVLRPTEAPLPQGIDAVVSLLDQVRRSGLVFGSHPGQGDGGDPAVRRVYYALMQLLPRLQSIRAGSDQRLASLYTDDHLPLHAASLHDALDASGARQGLPQVLGRLAQHSEAIPQDVLGSLQGASESALAGHVPSLLALYHGLLAQQQQMTLARPQVASMLGQGADLTSNAALGLKARLARKAKATDL